MSEQTDSKHLIKVNLRGGIVAAGDLLDILNAAEKAGIEKVSLGNRQQLFLSVAQEQLEDLEHEFSIADIDFEIGTDIYPNIVSSYVSEDIFSTSNWLREGVYKDIMDLFDTKPKLKINLADNNQTFIPFFTGNLNFIASDTSNYWHLHIRFPKTNIFYIWPTLIYTEDISALSLDIEKVILGNKSHFYDQPAIDGNLLFLEISSDKKVTRNPEEQLILPDFQLPYYEGFNKYDDKYWLGIYKRNEEYSVAFLKDVCAVCLQSRIGQINTTPWKSIIIKGISAEERKRWNWILAKHRINVRHASNELNWQIEDNCDYALKLKNHLVRQFDINDVRTFKLCFAIKVNPKTGLFGSVIIRKRLEDQEEIFDILHTRDFNPNSKDFVTYKEEVPLDNLPSTLVELCDYFYELQTNGNSLSAVNWDKNEDIKTEEAPVLVYQCTHCQTVYDPFYGDSLNNIPAGTPFKKLDENYCCQMCEAPKSDFIEVDKNSLVDSI
ncbi:rubredoxin [Pedobacter sp. P351]|uniref:rubredoxin n=1 Tax=Pedobacter superstes TaxID=3133441 RepID=UPI0030B468A8